MTGDPDISRFSRLLPAALPLAAYFGYLGFLHLRGRPTMISGRRDMFLLALALTPIPAAAIDWTGLFAQRFQALSAVALLVALVLTFAPREICSWVFYNADREDIERLIAESLDAMGETYQRRGDEFVFPERTLRLTVGSLPVLNNVVVHYSFRRVEDAPAVEYLEGRLRRRTGELASVSRAAGMPFLSAALAVLTVVIVEGGPRWAQIGNLIKALFG